MGLRKYFSKRRFDKTPEPRGQKTANHKKLAFVVQEHHATALHYDFRLELDGVLKSWAVPKGPSMNPHDHHLAIMTEDHPYDYRKFEGVIPEGNYGAGNVIIWDEGYYEPRQETNDPQAALRAGLKKGHITFVVHGKKLKGEFALIKMPHAKEDNAWLLIKKGDQYASTTDVTTQKASVKSGRNVDDLGAHDKLPDLSEYPKITKPWTVHPMLCTLVDEPFDREAWLFEIKWDGFRAIGTRSKTGVTLCSRNQLDFSQKFPPVAEALHQLEHDVILDGEIVVVDDTGTPHFEWLQSWQREPRGHLQYHVFDILWCDGHDVRTMPLIERKHLLKSVLPSRTVIHYGDHIATEGLALFHKMQETNMEGIVAKKADSPYAEEQRGPKWLKIKTHLRQEVVIGGFTEPRGGRKYLGSLLVGVYDKDKLVYIGHSGGGIPDDQRKTLREHLDKMERKTSPFTTAPKSNAPAHWVQPKLVCEMAFSEWTSEGSMRHPAFVGLRSDKEPTAVHREKPKKPSISTKTSKSDKAAAPDDEPFSLTHLDKVFFPKHKYTKGDLLHYYESIGAYILPYLKDRPLSLLRQPGGATDHGFFQKNMPNLPDWAPSADIYSDSHEDTLHWMVGGGLDTLRYAVQLGSIEINPWNSRVGQLDMPDWAVIDLDPEGVTFKDVIQVALTVKEVCDEWHIPAYPKTSGKTGIHIFIPMGAKYNYEQVKNFAHLFVLEVNRRQPKLTSVERMPKKRQHRIYLDFLQNRQGQTLAAPYSVRPTPDATVSMPLHWDEVAPGLKPTDFTIANALRRLNHTGDLWKPVLGPGVDIAKIVKQLEKTPPQ